MNNIGYGFFCFGEEYFYKGTIEKVNRILDEGFDCYVLTENVDYFKTNLPDNSLHLIPYNRSFKSYHDKMILPKHILKKHDIAILIDSDSRIFNYDFIEEFKKYPFKDGISYIDTLLNHSAKKEFVKDLGLESTEWSEYKVYAEKAYPNFWEFETIWEYFLVVNKNGFNSDVFYKYYEKLQLAKEFSDLPLNKSVNGAGEGISLAISAKMSNSNIQKDLELFKMMKRKLLCVSKLHTPKQMWPSFML